MLDNERKLQEIREALDVVANILAGLYVRLDVPTPAPERPAPAPVLTRFEQYVPDARYFDAISEVPEGYDTILGYLAKHHPDVLATLDYNDPEVTQRDGFKLAHWCRTECLPIVYVEAPPALKPWGITTIRAYPIELLERRWG